MDAILEAHVLSWMTLLPLATALALAAANALAGVVRTGGLPAPVWRVVGLASTLATLAIAVLGVWRRFDPEEPGFQLVEHVTWIPEWGVHYFVAIDGISLVLVMLTVFLMPVVFVSSWKEVGRSLESWVFFMLFLETGMLGAFTALNLFLFYLYWEVMLIPMYFIIGIWGGPRRVYAAIKFFLFTMLGSLLMLVAMLVVYQLNFEQGGTLNLDLVSVGVKQTLGILDTRIPVEAGGDVAWWQTQLWLFLAFALAFGIKVPIVPFHTWLPDAHVEAPTAGSVVLAGVLLKMGTYGFVRFALPLFPVAAVECVPWMFGAGLVGILYGSLVAMVQADVKKLVAYSSVAHLGFVVLGIFALNEQGLTGGVIQMVNHGLSTGALFILVGFLYERRHTRQIADFGGIARPMPIYAALFGIVTMASIGLPSLNGFVGEFLILLGTFDADRWVAAGAAVGVVLAAAYMLWMYRRVMFGPVVQPENRGLIDLDWRERGVVLAMIVPMVWIGLYPDPLLRRIEPSVGQVLAVMEERGARLRTPDAPVAEVAEVAEVAVRSNPATSEVAR